METVAACYASLDEWRKEGRRRFGDDEMEWRFVCPSCGHIARVQDWKDAGDKHGTMVAFSCVGRLLDTCADAFQMDAGPCNYAGGGLFPINPVSIAGRGNNIFAFAEIEEGAK